MGALLFLFGAALAAGLYFVLADLLKILPLFDEPAPQTTFMYIICACRKTRPFWISYIFSTEKRRAGLCLCCRPRRHTLLVLSPSLDARREPSSCATDATQRLRCMENSA